MAPLKPYKPVWEHDRLFKVCSVPPLIRRFDNVHAPPQRRHRVEVGDSWVKATFKRYDYKWLTNGKRGGKEVSPLLCCRTLLTFSRNVKNVSADWSGVTRTVPS